MDYIIVQAGGKGTRLSYLTKNKPKALVPVENSPMLFHLFRLFPDKRFIIIADYQRDVLRRYLSAFADVKYLLAEADGEGTVAGIKRALKCVPENEPFMLIWSDLILPENFHLPNEYMQKSAVLKSNYIGISESFPCRWKYKDGCFFEEGSVENGVAGFFLFKNKEQISGLPNGGELVRWLSKKGIRFKEAGLSGTKEYGLLSEYEKIKSIRTRPFNRISVSGNVLTKEPLDKQGKELAKLEAAWYEEAKKLKIPQIPQIYDTSPLKMEFIQGKNIFEYDFSKEKKKEILKSIIDTLRTLHETKRTRADYFSIKKAYYEKTVERLSKIRDLVPYANEKYITINGKKCRNVFFFMEELERRLDKIECEYFSFIHGDCTFSNMLLKDNKTPVLIDPRGYFGYTKLYGDERYDWAKLYYSIVGNYDRFNLKEFTLDIGGSSIYTEETGSQDKGLSFGEISLSISSNGWENMEDDFFLLTGADREEISLLHAVIWLSLTTYAWQDYDSICGAFYNGLYYLEDVL